MTYRFLANVHGPAMHVPIVNGERAPFSAFLTADMARVFLPVRPASEMAALYFLSCGDIWSDGNRFAPSNTDELSLVNELKKYHTTQHGTHRKTPTRVGESWEFVVPTNMQIMGAEGAAPFII